MSRKFRIADEASHRAALVRAGELMRALPETQEMDELEEVTAGIAEYEALATPLAEPTPEGFAEHLAEAAGDEYGLSRYVQPVSGEAIDAIVRYCGVALRGTDSQWVSVSDPQEVRRIVDGFCAKQLGLRTAVAEAAVKAVGERMRAERNKHRVLFYYLLAEQTGSLGRLAANLGAATPKAKHTSNAH